MRTRVIYSLLVLSGAAILWSAGTHAAAVVVAQDGSGDFRTVQAAVNAMGPDGGEIRIRPGLYEEKVVIEKSNIRMLGLGSDPTQVVLSWHLSAAMAGGTFKSASTTVTGDNFFAENLTFENTFSRGKPLGEGSQAVALRVTGDRAVFRHVRFLGYQDTLYATTAGCMNEGESCRPARQYFADCYVEGNVDFIFGDALAYFDRCEIHSLAHKMVAITAQSKRRPEERSGYVFNHCRLTAEPDAQQVYLGRPWRSYASVVFLNTLMGPEIAPAGWLEWEHDGKPSLPTAYFAEYQSKGPGARMDQRHALSVRLTSAEAAQYTPERFLAGTDGWDPTRIH
jgi:pectin methylesterase-like acyl-CoA thioesterase